MLQILLVHQASKGSFSRVFDFEANDLSEDDSISRTRYVYPLNWQFLQMLYLFFPITVRSNQGFL